MLACPWWGTWRCASPGRNGACCGLVCWEDWPHPLPRPWHWLVQGPQELVELPIHLLQPVFDSALMYRRQLQDIIAATQAEFAKVAEVQYATSRGQLQDFIDSAVHKSPSGSTSPFGAWQEAIKATTTLYESMQSTAKQAAEVVESNFKYCWRGGLAKRSPSWGAGFPGSRKVGVSLGSSAVPLRYQRGLGSEDVSTVPRGQVCSPQPSIVGLVPGCAAG